MQPAATLAQYSGLLEQTSEELLAIIVSFLESKACKRLRLVSRKFRRLVTASAFEIITFRIREDSIKKLFHVANDDQLCHYVKTVVFEPLEMLSFQDKEAFEQSIDQRDWILRAPLTFESCRLPFFPASSSYPLQTTNNEADLLDDHDGPVPAKISRQPRHSFSVSELD